MARMSYAVRIKSRISELEQIIAKANAELDELRVAEKVLGRLSDDVDEGDGVGTSQQAPSARDRTIPDQIIEILSERGPTETASIFERLNEIRNAPTSLATVQSTLSRIKTSGRIGHDGSRWYVIKIDSAQQVPQTNEAPEGAPKPSVFD